MRQSSRLTVLSVFIHTLYVCSFSYSRTVFREGAAPVAVATLVGLTAVGLAAATVQSPFADGAQPSGELESPQAEYESLGLLEVAPAFETVVIGLGAVAVVLLVLSALLDFEFTIKSIVGIFALSLFVVATLWVVSWLGDGAVFMTDSAGEEAAAEEGAEEAGDADGDPYARTLFALTLPILAFFLLFAASLLYTRGESATVDSGPETDDPEIGGTAAGVSAAADRALERIEADHEAIENEIYRAWYEMTTLLEVDRPATATPGEFADAAIDAGLDADAVEELTALFEAVRYGTAAETEARALRAIEVFERVRGTERSGEGSTGVSSSASDVAGAAPAERRDRERGESA